MNCTPKRGQKVRLVDNRKKGYKMRITKQQQEQLLNNPNVIKVSDYCIYYAQKFKEKALRECNLGKNVK